MRLVFLTSLWLSALVSWSQDSLFQIGEYHFQQAEYQKAFDAYKEAGEAFRIDKQLQEYALCNTKMALCFSRQAAFNQCLLLAENTLRYVEDIIPDNLFLKAESYRAMGEAYLNLGRTDKAQEVLLMAEKLYPENAELEKAEGYKLLGVIYLNNKNRDLSFQYLNRALDINRRILGNESLAVADVNNNIGLLYIDNDGLQAGIYLNRALKIYEANLGTLHPKVAFTLINLARAKSTQGINREAVETINRVQSIWNKLYEGDHPNKAFTLQALGAIYENEGDYAQALHLQGQALKQYIKLFGDKHPDVANSYFLIGKIHQKKADYKEAVLAFQQSIYANLPDQQFEKVYDTPQLINYFHPDYLLSSLIGKAQSLEALHFERTLRAKDLVKAIDTYKSADTLVTEIRKIRVTEQDKIRLTQISRDIYKNGIRLSLILSEQPFHQKKYTEIAFKFCERSKSSVLQEAIQETKAKSFSGIPADLITYEDSIKSQIAFFQQKIASGENIEANQKELFAYQQLYRDHIVRLEREFPKYYNLKYQTYAFSVDQIKQQVPDNTAMLSYYDAGDQLYIFILTKNGLKVSEMANPGSDKLISGLRNAVKYRINRQISSISDELFKVLVPRLPGYIHQLILIPDGILNTLPFESLKNPETQRYLVQDYAISYDYSSILMADRAKKQFDNSPKNILLCAPVDFSGSTMKLSPLPGTESELKEIRYLFAGNDWKVNPYLRAEASEDFIKNNSLEDYRYLHFATHGLVNESNPELSQIFLYPGGNEDGSLYSGDIYNLKINAELVSLSACETGLGQIAEGEGVLGLSRALLYAGAKNLMVSLWQVADQSTAELMKEFYQQHLFYDDVASFSEALRKAKLKMIESKTYGDPYYWAPFILVGQ